MTAVRVHISTFEYKDARFGWYELFADQSDLGSSDVEAYAAHNAIFFADNYIHPNLNAGETWYYWVRAVFDNGDTPGNLTFLGSIDVSGGGGSGSGGGADADARVLISEVVTSGSQATVDFTSIPGTYRDLEVRIRGRAAGTGTDDIDVRLQFNGDTGANYNRMGFVVNGSGGLSFAGQLGETYSWIGNITSNSAPANRGGFVTASIANYAGTVFYKTIQAIAAGSVSNSDTGGIRPWIFADEWESTAAINRVLVLLGGGNFVDGTVVSLYGLL